MSKFVSADIIKKINDIQIIDYINRVGIEVKQVSSNNPDYFKIPHNGGTYITPSKNAWNCFAMKTGSKSVIQFVQFIDNVSWKDAVDKIVDIYNLQENKKDHKMSFNVEKEKISEITPKKADVLNEKKAFVLPEKAENNKRVFAYLHKSRGIDNDIIQRAYNEKRIYQDAQKGNVIFKVSDNDGNIIGAAWNTTLTSEEHKGKKGFVEGSKRDYPFELRGTNNRLYIFESPIDMMSYMTIKKNNNNYINIKDSTFIATWGINSSEMILKYLEKNPNIEHITIAFDNDKDAYKLVNGDKIPCNHGQEAAKSLKDEIEQLDKKYIVDIDIPTLKDFNDDLLKIVKDKQNNEEQKKLNDSINDKEHGNIQDIDKLESEIKKLQQDITERKLDKLYSDSWQQSTQIEEDIENKENKLEILEKQLSEIKEDDFAKNTVTTKEEDIIGKEIPRVLKDLYVEEQAIKDEAKAVINSIEEMQEKLNQMKKNYESTMTKIIQTKNKIIIEQEKHYEEIIKNNAYIMISAGVDIDIVHQATKVPTDKLEAIQKEVVQQTQHIMYGQTPKIDYEFDKHLEIDEEYYPVLEKS